MGVDCKGSLGAPTVQRGDYGRCPFCRETYRVRGGVLSRHVPGGLLSHSEFYGPEAEATP